jgi:SAM-dependent methyltransferase
VSYQDDHVVLAVDALIPNIQHVAGATVTVDAESGRFSFAHLVERQLKDTDPLHAFTDVVWNTFGNALIDVLEIGSRRRAATAQALDFRSSARTYLGLDIVDAPNVDVVGDAHELARLIPDRQFDLIYSQYVFEHLAMPWVVVSEINNVMRPGADVVILTNQSIGLHDLPWDFWRFGESAWKSLFNADTGFELLSAGLGEPVKITPMRYHDGFRDHEGGVGFQASFAWARKVADLAPVWPVDARRIANQLSRLYPKEITD